VNYRALFEDLLVGVGDHRHDRARRAS
jgi:hypothetical protein